MGSSDGGVVDRTGSDALPRFGAVGNVYSSCPSCRNRLHALHTVPHAVTNKLWV